MPGTISRRNLLRSGGQAIIAGLPRGSNTIVVGVWMLQPGEVLIVAKRLREVLQDAVGA